MPKILHIKNLNSHLRPRVIGILLLGFFIGVQAEVGDFFLGKLVSGFCWAGEIDLNIIAYIESRNNPFAINFRTQCYGKYQVSQVCLTEYNQFNKTAYILTDMFNESLCERVALWYLNKRIPQMLRYFNKLTTTDNILWAYNAGIKRVVDNYMPNQTRNYIIKYKKLMESK